MLLTRICESVKLPPMKDSASKKTTARANVSRVKRGPLLTQLLTITDLTLRNSKDTQEQREALALKEILEQHAKAA